MLIIVLEEFIKLKGEKIKEKYNISENHLIKILNSPFKFAHNKIDDEKFETIRFKYFGSLKIFKGTAKGFLIKQSKKLEKGYITQEIYNNFKKQIDTKILKNELETKDK